MRVASFGRRRILAAQSSATPVWVVPPGMAQVGRTRQGLRPSSGFQALFRKNAMEAYREEHARPPPRQIGPARTRATPLSMPSPAPG